MKWGWRILLILLAAFAVAGGIMLAWPREREPEYGGKKLSEWVVLYSRGGAPGKAEAEDAVAHVGASGVPWLVKWMRYNEPPWHVRLLYYVVKQSPAGARRALAPVLTRLFGRRLERAKGSAEAFEVIGSYGRGAVADLVRMLTDPGSDPYCRARVFHAELALESLGRDALPSLVGAVGDPGQTNRAVIVRILGGRRCRAYTDVVVPVLLRCLEDRDVKVRMAARNALRKVAPDVLERMGEEHKEKAEMLKN